MYSGVKLLLKRRPSGGLWLVVGLGNPGDEYRQTRHNAGFMVVERLLKAHGFGRPRRRYEGRWAEGEIAGQPAAILMPDTYMNNSGDAVSLASKRKHIPIQRIIVIHDDMDFSLGVVRAKEGGGHGGHKGLKSIVARLGSDGFSRVRVGIGRPDRFDAGVHDWVLSPFEVPREELDAALKRAAACVETIVTGGIEAAMTVFNQRENGGDDGV